MTDNPPRTSRYAVHIYMGFVDEFQPRQNPELYDEVLEFSEFGEREFVEYLARCAFAVSFSQNRVESKRPGEIGQLIGVFEYDLVEEVGAFIGRFARENKCLPATQRVAEEAEERITALLVAHELEAA